MSEKNGSKFSESLKNGTGTLISRLFIILGMPALMGMGVWIGDRMVGTLDKLVEKVDTQREDTVKAINKLDVRMTVTERDVQYLKAK